METAGFTAFDREHELARSFPPGSGALCNGRYRERKALGANGPAAIANRIYANRLGSAPRSALTVGAPAALVTGNSPGNIVGIDLLTHPKWARELSPAVRIAFAFWDARKCRNISDCKTITANTKGSAKMGLKERIAATVAAVELLPI